MNLIRTIAGIIVLLMFAGTSYGQTSAELKKQRERITQEINLLNQSLKATSNSKTLTLRQVNALNTQITLRERKISTISSETRLIDRQIQENTQEIKKLEDQLEKLKKDYASMIRFAFRNKNGYNKMMFIFASKDFNQAFKRVKYLQQFSESRKNQAQEIEKTQKTIQNKIAELAANRKEKVDLLNEQQEERNTLNAQKADKSKVVNSFASQEKEYKAEITKKQQEASRLERAIQAAIRKEIEEEQRRAAEAARVLAELEAAKEAARAKAAGEPAKPVAVAKPAASTSASSVLSATPEAARLSNEFMGNRGSLPWPVAQGTITQGFGQHTYGAGVKMENNGLNIRTNNGAAVRAVFDGEVRSVVQMMGAGYAVIIRHGKYFSVYSNLKSVSVTRGQKVTSKQTIGTAATDPDEGTTEVHFEIWEGSAPINPTPWLARF
ncbi:murein hydrolase activator EnvC family protein [Albibacterium bauzanense]|uniref:Septal ring factor EnvC (AmiA/AmiB activator) n=1 Tax=Albibacterium bauzanense TaxID=653929 RepID=A0A4R1LVD6_9SPHI|nr:peptidoglycan DD-metalloendopeptidase family protein [Albibacterium bauzanense]TCK83055.1 septal ring factor EnvC (AmiA/AmiB activator) [Albibacterium bauzanense]